jgi:hypothetical protein
VDDGGMVWSAGRRRLPAKDVADQHRGMVSRGGLGCHSGCGD